MIAAARNTRIALCAALAAAGLALAAAAPAAQAAPVWRIDALADTTATAPGKLTYLIQITNVGDEEGVARLTVTLPEGVTVAPNVLSTRSFDPANNNTPLIACSPSNPSGASSFSCLVVWFGLSPIPGKTDRAVEIPVVVDAGAAGTLTSRFDLQTAVGGSQSASTVDSTRVAAEPPGFGASALDAGFASDPAGDPYSQAGGHPYSISTSIDFNTATNQAQERWGEEQEQPLVDGGAAYPVEPTRDVDVDLPAGLVGYPPAAPTCTAAQLIGNEGGTIPQSECPEASQVGTAMVRINGQGGHDTLGPIPLYNMAPPPGVPARFGFDVAGSVAILDARVRPEANYALAIDATGINPALPIASSTVTLWGAPAEESHRGERACVGETQPNPQGQGPTCASDAPEALAFLRMPTSCEAESSGLPFTAHLDSWINPGAKGADGAPELADPAWKEIGFRTHLPPAYPFPAEDWGPSYGPSGCERVPFNPGLAVEPTSHEADSPTGLQIDLTVPQQDATAPGAITQSDLRDASITLPPGMTVNPAQAAGRGSCSLAQVGMSAQGVPDNSAPTCPDSSKIGTLSLATPLLSEELQGSVYLAKQSENPFGSLLALYLVAKGPGFYLKLAGEVKTDPQSGRLTTVFSDQPQLPFERLHVELFGGSRSALVNPPTCGTTAARAVLTPWSGNPPVHLDGGFEVTSGPGGSPCPAGGFDPRLRLRTANPLAGAYSPLQIDLSRADATQRLAGLSAKLPEGLLAKLAGVPYCPDSALASFPAETLLGAGAGEEAHPSCPAASRVGTVTVGAGAGANPFYTAAGRAYLAGPYKGAPLSIATVVPAVAGPFDLGSVMVRNALRIDPETAQATVVSDPLPTILHGIPLDLRQIRIETNRPEFDLNPTSCDPMATRATITSAQGATADLSDRFQVGGCEALGFRPKLALSLSGKTHRSGHPALKATLTLPAGGANPAESTVVLPRTELLENAHIRTVCTRVQFAAQQCPPGSVYGHATAWTPLLSEPLSGPVYLRSNGGERQLPDLVADLQGQIEVTVVGYVDAVHSRLRTRFATIPDAPLTKFVLSMQGGKKGLLANNTNICRVKPTASVFFAAHNGKTKRSSVPVRADCGRRHRR